MRVTMPQSLLLITLVRGDQEKLDVCGPFSSITCMDNRLTGEYYPHGKGKPDTILAIYDPEMQIWKSVSGSRLLAWTIQSVDEVQQNGNRTERNKARYVVSEFSTLEEAKEG